MQKMRGVPDPIDVHVGARVRLRRTLLGMSQQKLGKALGLTFQQIQKYERGANRIGSSRLYRLSRILDVPVSFFFDELPDEVVAGTKSVDTSPAKVETDYLSRRETLELVRAYYKIRNEKSRKGIANLVKALAKAS